MSHGEGRGHLLLEYVMVVSLPSGRAGACARLASRADRTASSAAVCMAGCKDMRPFDLHSQHRHSLRTHGFTCRDKAEVWQRDHTARSTSSSALIFSATSVPALAPPSAPPSWPDCGGAESDEDVKACMAHTCLVDAKRWISCMEFHLISLACSPGMSGSLKVQQSPSAHSARPWLPGHRAAVLHAV